MLYVINLVTVTYSRTGLYKNDDPFFLTQHNHVQFHYISINKSYAQSSNVSEQCIRNRHPINATSEDLISLVM